MREFFLLKEFAELLIGLCLKKLVELGRVQNEQVNGTWYVEFNEVKLKSKGFAGAATLDKINLPVIYLLPQLTPAELMFIISHEAVHLMQICKGDLTPGFDYMIWKGQSYTSLPYNHPDYFQAQPWEKEARELEPILLRYLESKMQPANL